MSHRQIVNNLDFLSLQNHLDVMRPFEVREHQVNTQDRTVYLRCGNTPSSEHEYVFERLDVLIRDVRIIRYSFSHRGSGPELSIYFGEELPVTPRIIRPQPPFHFGANAAPNDDHRGAAQDGPASPDQSFQYGAPLVPPSPNSVSFLFNINNPVHYIL